MFNILKQWRNVLWIFLFNFNAQSIRPAPQSNKLDFDSTSISVNTEIINLHVRENEISTNLTIPLDDSEYISPEISTNSLEIKKDGRIILKQPFNYEVVRFIDLKATIVDYHSNKRVQPIRINVIDINEPPAFINYPRPLLSVVPLGSPVGRIVYQFAARTENGDGESNLRYETININPSGSFLVEPRTGLVRTGWRSYLPSSKFHVTVQAVDNESKSKSNLAVLEILSGDRPPQFLQNIYNITVMEDAEIGQSLVQVGAKAFPSYLPMVMSTGVEYELLIDDQPSVVRIDNMTGTIYLKENLDYDKIGSSHTFKYKVIARENQLQSSAELIIHVIDVNDNAPKFGMSVYRAHVLENITKGSVFLRVKATDIDEGFNSQVKYKIHDPQFGIDINGGIFPISRLDADHKSFYKIPVCSEDKGSPSLSSCAMVHISVGNVNDEYPVFYPTSHYIGLVAEDAQGGTPVIQVNANDSDQDGVGYSIVSQEGDPYSNMFHIDKYTGLIKLANNITASDLLQFKRIINLTIKAEDDGRCCGSDTIRHHSFATVLIGIQDVNNHKPVFRNCSHYSNIAQIREGAYRNVSQSIIQVKATDEDVSSNGDVVYSIYYHNKDGRRPFVIDSYTGVIKPSPHVLFDRELRATEFVTVKATDRGDRPLIGFCQFSVKVIDVNDNPPVFERPLYEGAISRKQGIGTIVLRVSAFDIDEAQNAKITYQLQADAIAGREHQEDHKYFSLNNSKRGTIRLKLPIPFNKNLFVFNVMASDNGIDGGPLNSTAQVYLHLTDTNQSAPIWQNTSECQENIKLKEDFPINKIFLKCRATSINADAQIIYRIESSSIDFDSKFRLLKKFEKNEQSVELAVIESLDYEQQQSYSFRLIAEVTRVPRISFIGKFQDVTSRLSSSRQFRLEIDDVNDEVPSFIVDRFTGTIDEGLNPDEYMERSNGSAILYVKAVDLDGAGPQNEIKYRILNSTRGATNFRINESTGGIYPRKTFDREMNEIFILTVEARDNCQSALSGIHGPNRDYVKVQIFINDVNDNPPSFKHSAYFGNVIESETIGHNVMTINAFDIDSKSTIRYQLLSHDIQPFAVDTITGTIYVTDTLDYELTSNYSFKLIAIDGKYETMTNVFIEVLNINDNPPVFERDIYTAQIIENSKVGDFIFQVKADDTDGKKTEIVYRIEGQGASDLFEIGEYNGLVKLKNSIDRDPPHGFDSIQFVIQAIDANGTGLIGYSYAEIKVIDINDNPPIFSDPLLGSIKENVHDESQGIFVMNIKAIDLDDPNTDNGRIEYNINKNIQVNSREAFRIDENNGNLYSMVMFDYEDDHPNELIIEICAMDKGVPKNRKCANVTVNVIDENDNAPFFEKVNSNGSILGMTPRKETPIATRQAVINMRENGMRGTEIAMELYYGKWDESLDVGSAILSLNANDNDSSESQGNVEYYLNGTSEEFYITTETDGENKTSGVIRLRQVCQSSFMGGSLRPNNGTH